MNQTCAPSLFHILVSLNKTPSSLPPSAHIIKSHHSHGQTFPYNFKMYTFPTLLFSQNFSPAVYAFFFFLCKLFFHFFSGTVHNKLVIIKGREQPCFYIIGGSTLQSHAFLHMNAVGLRGGDYNARKKYIYIYFPNDDRERRIHDGSMGSSPISFDWYSLTRKFFLELIIQLSGHPDPPYLNSSSSFICKHQLKQKNPRERKVVLTSQELAGAHVLCMYIL